MTLAIIQARMSSSRLPGKVMKPVLGQPMIGRQIERLQRAKRLSRIIVATVKYEGFLEESSRTSPAAACIDAVEPASR